MKKASKKSVPILLALLLALALSACGGKAEENTSAVTGKNPESISQNGTTSTEPIGTNNIETSSNQTKVYPIEIKLLDEKHADFYFNLEEMKDQDVDLSRIFALSCTFPASKCEIRYEGELPVGDGSYDTVPPSAYAYCDTIGDFGEVGIERENDKQFVLHLDLTEDESITDIYSIIDGSDACTMSYCLFDDDNEYEAEYRCTDIINQRAYQSRYNNGTGKPDDTGGQGTGEPVVSNAGDPTSVSLNDFVGDYRGINLFFVVDWETYEMSEDVDHSSLSFVKAEDGYELKNIVIDDIRAPKRHKTLNPVVLHDSDMAYYLDTDTNEDDPIPWDCLIIETDYADIIFSKWQKNGQLMITIDIGDGVPQVFIPQAA